jgi:predicted phosphodiesterase
VRRVALLGDVHGNAVALAAVLEELRREEPDLVVWTGDLSWGWEPAATLALVRALGLPARYVRGNAERALLELRAGDIAEEQLVEIIEKPPAPAEMSSTPSGSSSRGSGA